MCIALISLILLSSNSFAADTNSDLFTACPKQREELNKFTGGGSSKCQDILAKAAKCCNLYPGCEVQGIAAGATQGNVDGGQLLIASLQARIAGIDSNIHKCDEVSASADLPCYSEKFNATSADKQLKIKFNNVAAEFRKCMAAEKVATTKAILQAGGAVKESGGTPRYGDNTTEQQILQQLRGQQGK